MLRIGLTGGVGCGKSTVAAIFELLDIPVYYADSTARKLMEEHDALRNAITEHFGAESYSDGHLNRAYLSSVVFSHPEKLARLNALVHPVTIADSSRWMEQQKTLGAPYAIKEAALVFESDSHLHLDYVIGVSSPLPLRIRRVMERDGTAEAAVTERIRNQMDEEEKMKRCDFILRNDEHEMLIPQVLALHQKLISMAAGK